MRMPATRRGRWALGIGGATLVILAAGAWIGLRAHQAQSAVAQLQTNGTRLQQQLSGYDLAAAGTTLTAVRQDSQRAHDLTGDPVWGVAAAIPVLGRDLRAARDVSSVLAGVASAAQPLETALPQLDPQRTQANGGRIDTAALSTLSQALPAVSTQVSAGAVTIGQLNPAQLQPRIASGVTELNKALSTARQPLAEAVPVMRDLPGMLGSTGQREWVVLLQQDAEARGTGGLVGAYAVIRTDHGKLDLAQAEPRGELDRGPAIPVKSAPADLRKLWGKDLTEWAGFNGSAHFPSTGALVSAGWQRHTGGPAPDYVAAVDQYVVAALLAGTGPVTVRGVTVDQRNAVSFLSKDIYARWSNPHDVDAVTTELVRAVFGRVTAGSFDLPALVKAMKEPVEQRRLLLWAGNTDQQQRLQRFPVSGALPGEPGPFAMAVVNNGGGNKMDAYLKVSTDYQPGACTQGIRVNRVAVTLQNTAPRGGKGLPSYVNVRSDLIQKGLDGNVTHDGSNRILLDVYGPVGSQAALTTLDGEAVAPVVGQDQNHTVWRVTVPIEAGQTRTVSVVMTSRAVSGDARTTPVVIAQPMVIPASVITKPLPLCNLPATSTEVSAG